MADLPPVQAQPPGRPAPHGAGERTPGAPSAPPPAAEATRPGAVLPPAAGRAALPSPPPGIGNGGTPVAVTESATDLRGLPVPANLAARVIATDSGGTIRLETVLGRITVTAAKMSADVGATARLQFEAGGTVRLQVNQTPAGGQSLQSASGTASAGRGTGATLQPGDVVQARLVPLDGAAQGAQARPAPSAVTIRVISVDQPATPMSPPARTASPMAAQPTSPMAAQPSSQPTGQPAVQPAAQSGLASLQATVTGRTALGQPVLDTGQGRLVPSSGDLPDGARVRLEVVTTSQAAARPAAVIAPLAGALDDVLMALTATHPAVAAALDAGRIPRFGPKLASATLFLISALSGGGLKGVIDGDAQAALQRTGRGALLARLSEALTQRGPRAEGETASSMGELWRSIFVPVATAQGWQPLRVAWRDPDEAKGGDDEDERARFQIDFSFSKLGPIRLDGLVGTGRLDLLLVSRAPFGASESRKIERLFTDTIEAMGLKGHIRFVEQTDLTAPEVRADQPHASVTA